LGELGPVAHQGELGPVVYQGAVHPRLGVVDFAVLVELLAAVKVAGLVA